MDTDTPDHDRDMADQPPCRVKLGLCGARRGTYVFMVRVEERSGSMALMDGETVEMPWLRACCTCGWKARRKERMTVEENAHWQWLNHVRKHHPRAMVPA